MPTCLLKITDQVTIPIHPIVAKDLNAFLGAQDVAMQQWVAASDFKASPASYCLIPDRNGQVRCVLLGIADRDDFWSFGLLPLQLPQGVYLISDNAFSTVAACARACLAWGLGAYQFSRYCKAKPSAELLLPDSLIHPDTDDHHLLLWVETLQQGRDWVNLPADVMTPEYLTEVVKGVAKECSAKVRVVAGEKLLKANFPAIYAVGRGSRYEPRFIELNWGDRGAPLLTLIGKGVCFDSGGLNLKSSAAIRLMKKDMSGAAHALALARMIMKASLPIRLRLLIPAVENSVDAYSYRPGDVITTRSGLHVEIDNTDAEGRMVLCDALTAAMEEQPQLVIDFASLTGAARVALGPDIPAFYCNDDQRARRLLAASQEQHDPLWRMPLYQPYQQYLRSDVADCLNASRGGFAGSITAALYLQQFVSASVPWIHFDFSAWNFEARPGRPKGGEIVALRAVFAFLKNEFVYC